jgi:hypothetical protein
MQSQLLGEYNLPRSPQCAMWKPGCASWLKLVLVMLAPS